MSPEILNPQSRASLPWVKAVRAGRKNLAAEGRRSNDDVSSAITAAGLAGTGCEVKVLRLREEICVGGRNSLTAGTSGGTARPVQAGTEVGEAHKSSEVANPHGAKEPHLIDACREGKDW